MMPQRSEIKRRITRAVSIWFEIWGVVDPGKKNFGFYRQISEKFQFFQAILQKNIEFCRQISENFDFFRQQKKLIFQAKKVHLQLPLGKLFYFSSKVTTFEHTSLYIVRYNNISRPVHDSNDPPCDPPFDPTAQNLGVATLSSQDYRPWIAMEKKPFPGGKNYQGEAGLRRMKMPQEKNGENIDLKCDLVLCRNKDYEKGGHHKIGSL